jgi:quinolinate synthase
MSPQTDRIRRLKEERQAVILAHNYQLPEVQDIADHVGDSLALARLAGASDAPTIVMAGVYFMAETAKILNPRRRVLIPRGPAARWPTASPPSRSGAGSASTRAAWSSPT